MKSSKNVKPDMTNPLSLLIVDSAESLDLQALASTLRPYISFDDDNDLPLIFSQDFRRLPNLQKLELAFLASKARNLLSSARLQEGFTQKEMIVLDIAPTGSIKATMKTLADSGIIIKRGDKYSIPNYKLPEVLKKYPLKESED